MDLELDVWHLREDSGRPEREPDLPICVPEDLRACRPGLGAEVVFIAVMFVGASHTEWKSHAPLGPYEWGLMWFVVGVLYT